MNKHTYVGVLVAAMTLSMSISMSGCGGSSNANDDGGIGTNPDPLAAEWLEAHNDARASAGPPTPSPALAALTWSDTGAAQAKAWAQGCTWDHNPNRGNFGENIAAFTGGATPTHTVDLWDSEKQDYDYNANKCADTKTCGHYTQLVWRNTTSVGCAISQCTTGSPFMGDPSWTFLVCDYAPPGNFNKQKPY